MTPAIDVQENEAGIVLRADLPGVSKERLDIRVDGETLTIEGQASLGDVDGMQPLYAEVRDARYKRSFVLSRDLDTSRIDATMRNGVLTISVPKLEQAKPRRIAVRAE
jgi:HSP20 family molecular chaperone IbpA